MLILLECPAAMINSPDFKLTGHKTVLPIRHKHLNMKTTHWNALRNVTLLCVWCINMVYFALQWQFVGCFVLFMGQHILKLWVSCSGLLPAKMKITLVFDDLGMGINNQLLHIKPLTTVHHCLIKITGILFTELLLLYCVFVSYALVKSWWHWKNAGCCPKWLQN